MSARQRDEAQEAEFGRAEGGEGAAIEWEDGYVLYPW